MEEYKDKFQKTFVNISSRKSQLLFQTKKKKKCPFHQNCTHGMFRDGDTKISDI